MKSTAQIISEDYSKLVGIPYIRKNCWELAKDFYSVVFGIQLKHYYLDMPKDRQAYQDIIYSSKGDFTKVEEPQFGDLILLRVRGLESHIAVYVGDGKMLHTTRNTGSVIDRVEKWKTLIAGYYRV